MTIARHVSMPSEHTVYGKMYLRILNRSQNYGNHGIFVSKEKGREREISSKIFKIDIRFKCIVYCCWIDVERQSKKKWAVKLEPSPPTRRTQPKEKRNGITQVWFSASCIHLPFLFKYVFFFSFSCRFPALLFCWWCVAWVRTITRNPRVHTSQDKRLQYIKRTLMRKNAIKTLHRQRK